MMEVGTEISQKIRSAIKAKLLELGSYVDDELPDYIMVMVANKKTRSQMNSDLGLFLGTNTNPFTEWLHGLLDKLQSLRIGPDKHSSKREKSDKSKSSKERRRDKSHKDSSSKKKSSESKDKNETVTDGGNVSGSEYVSNNTTTDTTTASDRRKSESSEDAHSNSTDEQLKHVNIVTGIDSSLKRAKDTSDRVGKQFTKSCISEDFEDVRSLLVTEAAGDALAEELETAEVEVVQSRTVKEATKQKTSLKDVSQVCTAVTSQPFNTRDQSPEHCSLRDTKKRKTPTSVVASITRKVENEEEYDPLHPAVGSVASVVKVTTRKSSIPPLLQANKLLLLKAMTEAERSVSEKKKVAIKKPRDESPIEVYSPKPTGSDQSRDQPSPPPYIPSRKSSSSHHSDGSKAKILTRNDARHVLNRDSRRKLKSKSRRMEVQQNASTDRVSPHRQRYSRSPERDRRQRDNDRDVKNDKGVKSKNLEITCHVSSKLGSSAYRQVDSRKRHLSSSPEIAQTLKVTFNPTPSQESKTERIGKIVVDRNAASEDTRETVSVRTVSSTGPADAREDIIAKVGQSKSKRILSQKTSSSGRVISSIGKAAVQKQCEAAVISVKTAPTSSRPGRNVSPDSRVVECDTQSIEDEEDMKADTVVESAVKRSTEMEDVSVRSKSPASGGDDDDLSKMIDEDLAPELLDDANDEFTLNLDIDDDLSHVVGLAEDETEEADIPKQQSKEENRSGTRFIVTLDGVDERQFHDEDSGAVFDKFKQPLVAATPAVVAPLVPSNPEELQQNQNVYLGILPSQSVPVSQALPQKAQMLSSSVPSKLTPPRIQPFSISLKDSDDEHEDKEGKPSAIRQEYYQQTEIDVSAVKRAKLTERCKFWPACAAGVSCEYHHPTTHCKTFPNCKFGDKCLFIHPNCRFDSKCARLDCPYTHTSRRPALSGPTHVVPVPKPHFVFTTAPPKPPTAFGYGSTQTMCRYFPNCHNVNCPFFHPRPCKFGVACKSTACAFYHTPVPGKDKLKWQASSGQLKTETATVSSSAKEEMAADKPSTTTPTNSAMVSSTSQ